MISPSQRPLPDNTQHSQQTNIHATGGIRTHDRSRRAAVDLRLIPRGYWDRLLRRFWLQNNEHYNCLLLKTRCYLRFRKICERSKNRRYINCYLLLALKQEAMKLQNPVRKKCVSCKQTRDGSTYLWLHCWQAKHSRWYTLFLALMTISKAGITLAHAAQCPVLPNNL